MKRIAYTRLILKSGDEKPTLPYNIGLPFQYENHTEIINGYVWKNSDIYENELYVDSKDDKLYIRINSDIHQICLDIDDLTGKTIDEIYTNIKSKARVDEELQNNINNRIEYQVINSSSITNNLIENVLSSSDVECLMRINSFDYNCKKMYMEIEYKNNILKSRFSENDLVTLGFTLQHYGGYKFGLIRTQTFSPSQFYRKEIRKEILPLNFLGYGVCGGQIIF